MKLTDVIQYIVILFYIYYIYQLYRAEKKNAKQLRELQTNLKALADMVHKHIGYSNKIAEVQNYNAKTYDEVLKKHNDAINKLIDGVQEIRDKTFITIKNN